jgi:hypothetical protein
MLSAASCHTAAPSDVRQQVLKFSYGSWVCRCPGSSSQVQETGPSMCSCYSLEPRRESAGFPPTVGRHPPSQAGAKISRSQGCLLGRAPGLLPSEPPHGRAALSNWETEAGLPSATR